MITIVHQQGTCAAKHKRTTRYQDTAKTLCDCVVNFAFGFHKSYSKVTCPDCLLVLKNKKRKKK